MHLLLENFKSMVSQIQNLKHLLIQSELFPNLYSQKNDEKVILLQK